MLGKLTQRQASLARFCLRHVAKAPCVSIPLEEEFREPPTPAELEAAAQALSDPVFLLTRREEAIGRAAFDVLDLALEAEFGEEARRRTAVFVGRLMALSHGHSDYIAVEADLPPGFSAATEEIQALWAKLLGTRQVHPCAKGGCAACGGVGWRVHRRADDDRLVVRHCGDCDLAGQADNEEAVHMTDADCVPFAVASGIPCHVGEEGHPCYLLHQPLEALLEEENLRLRAELKASQYAAWLSELFDELRGLLAGTFVESQVAAIEWKFHAMYDNDGGLGESSAG